MHVSESYAELVTATESVSESSPTANTQDSTSKVSYYDPVRDT